MFMKIDEVMELELDFFLSRTAGELEPSSAQPGADGRKDQ
jgi:hypothetical protein